MTEETDMTVVLTRREGQGCVIRFRNDNGTEQDVVIYARKAKGKDRVKLYFTVLDSKDGKKVPVNVTVHRIEHFAGEEFERFLEAIPKPEYKDVNIEAVRRYQGIYVPFMHERMDEDQNERRKEVRTSKYQKYHKKGVKQNRRKEKPNWNFKWKPWMLGF